MIQLIFVCGGHMRACQIQPPPCAHSISLSCHSAFSLASFVSLHKGRHWIPVSMPQFLLNTSTCKVIKDDCIPFVSYGCFKPKTTKKVVGDARGCCTRMMAVCINRKAEFRRCAPSLWVLSRPITQRMCVFPSKVDWGFLKSQT